MVTFVCPLDSVWTGRLDPTHTVCAAAALSTSAAAPGSGTRPPLCKPLGTLLEAARAAARFKFCVVCTDCNAWAARSSVSWARLAVSAVCADTLFAAVLASLAVAEDAEPLPRKISRAATGRSALTRVNVTPNAAKRAARETGRRTRDGCLAMLLCVLVENLGKSQFVDGQRGLLYQSGKIRLPRNARLFRAKLLG